MAQKRKQLIHDKIGFLFSSRELLEVVEDLQSEEGFSDNTKRRIISSAQVLNADWEAWKESRLYSFTTSVDFIEVLRALCRRKHHYISHYSAMYYHGLIEQRPNDHFITHEVPGKSTVRSSGNLDPFRVRQAFLKPARQTSNLFEYDGQKFSLLEKVDLNEIGVEILKSQFENSEISLKVTNITRTFVDAVIAPQYCGGITTVINAFHNQKFNTDELKYVYDRINPIYPYWQVIGALLQHFAKESDSKRWSALFSAQQKIPFYVEHEAKSSWAYSPEWSIYFPKGSLLDA